MRQRLPTLRAVSIALCLLPCTTSHGRLAAQTDRLVLTETNRQVMPANIFLHGGRLSPRGDGSLFWSSDTVWIASPQHLTVRPICPHMVQAPLGAAFTGDEAATEAPVVEILDGGVEGTTGPRLIRYSNGKCRADRWNGPTPHRSLTRVGERWVFVDAIEPGPPSGFPMTRFRCSWPMGTPWMGRRSS